MPRATRLPVAAYPAQARSARRPVSTLPASRDGIAARPAPRTHAHTRTHSGGAVLRPPQPHRALPTTASARTRRDARRLLCRDAPFRASVVAEIVQRRAALFGDERVAPAWAAFLRNATAAAGARGDAAGRAGLPGAEL
jgi:hypothetical protein